MTNKIDMEESSGNLFKDADFHIEKSFSLHKRYEQDGSFDLRACS